MASWCFQRLFRCCSLDQWPERSLLFWFFAPMRRAPPYLGVFSATSFFVRWHGRHSRLLEASCVPCFVANANIHPRGILNYHKRTKRDA